MKITMLNGPLGCSDCQREATAIGYRRQTGYGFVGLGAVSDYEQITVGGKTYTANQLLDKTLIAAKDTKVYKGSRATSTVVGTVKAGQPIGKVYSFIAASSPNADGRAWLMFDGATGFYFAPNEAASGSGLTEQGAQTVADEIKKEQEELLRQNSPVEYYLKKYGVPALLIVGVIVIVGGVAKETVKGAFNKKSVTTT